MYPLDMVFAYFSPETVLPLTSIVATVAGAAHAPDTGLAPHSSPLHSRRFPIPEAGRRGEQAAPPLARCAGPRESQSVNDGSGGNEVWDVGPCWPCQGGDLVHDEPSRVPYSFPSDPL